MSKNAIILIIIAVVGLTYCHHVRKEERKERERKRIEYMNSPEGMNKKARTESMRSDFVVTSPTGVKFFHGKQCWNCEEYVRGYKYATINGIAYEETCEKLIGEAYNGCLAGVSYVQYQIAEEVAPHMRF